jgi:type IX secretion system PorP/SprF family membrane protein
MRILFFIFIVNACVLAAQQTLMYTQYTFNKTGMNPAASGTDIKQDFYYVYGLNRQWLAFENAPKGNFVNFSYTLRPPRSYRFWQNFGIYADNEDAGLVRNFGVYGTYAIHTLLRKKTVLSMGIFAGARRYARSTSGFDQNDPAVQNSNIVLWMYPDIIPGIRLSTKEYFMGLSVRQIIFPSLKNFNGNQIGSPSKLRPNIYFEYGRTTELSDQLLMMPSFAINAPIIGPPTVDGTLMFYYANRIGIGAAARNLNFASGILQIRFLKNMTAGFAYSYPLNKTRFVSQHSYEIMIGITPLGMNTNLIGPNAIVRCPSLTY